MNPLIFYFIGVVLFFIGLVLYYLKDITIGRVIELFFISLTSWIGLIFSVSFLLAGYICMLYENLSEKKFWNKKIFK